MLQHQPQQYSNAPDLLYKEAQSCCEELLKAARKQLLWGPLPKGQSPDHDPPGGAIDSLRKSAPEPHSSVPFGKRVTPGKHTTSVASKRAAPPAVRVLHDPKPLAGAGGPTVVAPHHSSLPSPKPPPPVSTHSGAFSQELLELLLGRPGVFTLKDSTERVVTLSAGPDTGRLVPGPASDVFDRVVVTMPNFYTRLCKLAHPAMSTEQMKSYISATFLRLCEQNRIAMGTMAKGDDCAPWLAWHTGLCNKHSAAIYIFVHTQNRDGDGGLYVPTTGRYTGTVKWWSGGNGHIKPHAPLPGNVTEIYCNRLQVLAASGFDQELKQGVQVQFSVGTNPKDYTELWAEAVTTGKGEPVSYVQARPYFASYASVCLATKLDKRVYSGTLEPPLFTYSRDPETLWQLDSRITGKSQLDTMVPAQWKLLQSAGVVQKSADVGKTVKRIRDALQEMEQGGHHFCVPHWVYDEHEATLEGSTKPMTVVSGHIEMLVPLRFGEKRKVRLAASLKYKDTGAAVAEYQLTRMMSLADAWNSARLLNPPPDWLTKAGSGPKEDDEEVVVDPPVGVPDPVPAAAAATGAGAGAAPANKPAHTLAAAAGAADPTFPGLTDFPPLAAAAPAAAAAASIDEGYYGVVTMYLPATGQGELVDDDTNQRLPFMTRVLLEAGQRVVYARALSAGGVTRAVDVRVHVPRDRATHREEVLKGVVVDFSPASMSGFIEGPRGGSYSFKSLNVQRRGHIVHFVKLGMNRARLLETAEELRMAHQAGEERMRSAAGTGSGSGSGRLVATAESFVPPQAAAAMPAAAAPMYAHGYAAPVAAMYPPAGYGWPGYGGARDMYHQAAPGYSAAGPALAPGLHAPNPYSAVPPQAAPASGAARTHAAPPGQYRQFPTGP